MSLVEGLVYFLLVVGLIGFLVAAYRWYTVSSAGQNAEAAELREGTLFMERLRRILRFGVVRVIPTSAGIRVIHWTMDRDGSWRLVETLFENSGERGVLVITDHEGNQHTYNVGQDEDGALIIDAVVDGEVLRITLDGMRVLTQVVVVASTRQKGETWILRQPGDPGTTIEEVLEELRNGRDAFPELGPAPDMGEADEAETGLTGLVGEDQIIEGEASPSPRSLTESWFDEADLVGIEATPLGQVFLPPEPPPGTAATPANTLRDRLEQNGFGPEKAEAVGGVFEQYEEGVLSGDRRQAAEALTTLEQFAEADGMTAEDLVDMVTTVSNVGQSMAEANPDGFGQAADPTVIETPETLEPVLDDIPGTAALPGGWGEPPGGAAPGQDPNDPFDAKAARELCMDRCNSETGGNPLCPMGCDAAVKKRQEDGPIGEPCASECLSKFESWACAVFCDMNGD
jgi:hypothetical protein